MESTVRTNVKRGGWVVTYLAAKNSFIRNGVASDPTGEVTATLLHRSLPPRSEGPIHLHGLQHSLPVRVQEEAELVAQTTLPRGKESLPLYRMDVDTLRRLLEREYRD
jgi:hypothetical protein